MLKKKIQIGRRMDEITVGEKLSITEKIEDKDLLLYLGLTNDSNPLYIQHDYASQTPYENLQIHFEVVAVAGEEHTIDMRVFAYDEKEEVVVKGVLTVAPPYKSASILEKALDNF
ncbi:enoyl-CoA hydratase [Bacillus pseudomycoides]|uniref:enoyl-CoA hydratase n=1 Tax=Bacillus pseudomycoides TaxID=64104 RepID=UPI002E1A7F6A|nr:enoyl-CoA hydratase [Bacillus pseudomycoides]